MDKAKDQTCFEQTQFFYRFIFRIKFPNLRIAIPRLIKAGIIIKTVFNIESFGLFHVILVILSLSVIILSSFEIRDE